MAHRVRIGLLLNRWHTWGRGIIEGVYDFAEAHGQWLIRVFDPETREIRRLKKFNPQGVIAFLNNAELAREVLRLRVTTVNVSGELHLPKVPRVGLDDEMIGRMAAQHLLERGLRHFGFYGHLKSGFTQRREIGFRAELANRGFDVSVLRLDPERLVSERFEPAEVRVRRWLMKLQKPVGVMADMDLAGRALTEVCRDAGVSVPTDLAVIGVDDDELQCRIAHPPLSSIRTPPREIGHRAGQILEGLLEGRDIGPMPVILPPVMVVPRASTDVLLLADPEVTAALRFIRDNVEQRITVDDVLAAVPISRSWLERRFKAMLGRTPYEEIQRMHIERARKLLAETDWSIARIAESSGYASASRFSHAFRREMDMTPVDYRRRVKGT